MGKGLEADSGRNFGTLVGSSQGEDLTPAAAADRLRGQSEVPADRRQRGRVGGVSDPPLSCHCEERSDAAIQLEPGSALKR